MCAPFYKNHFCFRGFRTHLGHCLIGMGLRGVYRPDLVCPPFVFGGDVFQPSFKRSLEFLPDCIGCDDGRGCYFVTVYNTASHTPDEVQCDVVKGSSHGVHGGFLFGDRAEHGPSEGW